MNDPLNRLEEELSGMKPVQISTGLANRIEAALKVSEGRVSPWPDRFLFSAICSGALAACVIVAVLLNGVSAPAAPIGTVLANSPTSQFGGAPLAFAQSDPLWLEILK